MLSKCANPSCFGAFRYLHEGRIFHLALKTTEQSGTVCGRSQVERFWLCGQCSQKLTLIPNRAGILAVPLQRTSQPSWNSSQPGKGEIMPFQRNRNGLLELLKRELAFLTSGYYARGRKSRTPSLLFENSPICPNSGGLSPRHPCSECELFQFVPSGHRGERVPCRYIPLNLSGDTLDGLYGYASDQELRENLVDWLCENIAHLESERAHAEGGESRMEMQ